ncbi:SPFH domain-containing protein [Streptomyces vinaceus]|uniref:SPFH domain-containing protein n=1 Tax=Streptomyces vinaceus TaxID=1960 RepID=UPI00381F30C3
MYPTRTTSTTGTFRIPPAPPQAAAVRATGELYAPALTPRPATPPPPAASATPFPPTAWAAPEPRSAVGAAQPGHEPLAGLDAPLPYGTRTQAAPDRVTPLAAEPALTAEAWTASALPPVARTRSEFGRAAAAPTGTAPEPADGAPEGLSPLGAPSGPAAESAAGLSTPGAEVGHAAEAGAAVVPAPHSAQPVAAALPGPCEAAAAAGTGTAQAGQPGRGTEAPVRALGTVVGGAEAAAPGVDAGHSVPAGTVALPHGRPAAEATWSEVPAARIQVEPEPVHALAGAGERAESGGSPYGHEPEHLGSVPAPAAHPHSAGVPTLRLRAESAPPAGPDTQLPTDSPAAPHTETGPGALRSHAEAGSAPAADAGARDVAAGSGAESARQVPYVPQPQADADGRAESGGTRPPAGDDRPGAEPARAVPYVPHPQAEAGVAPAADAEQRGPQSYAGDQGGSGAADGVEAGPRGPHAEPGVGGSASPYADAGPRAVARTGQAWPVADGDVGDPAQRYGEPWPPGAPAPHAPSAIGAGAESPRDIAARAVARGIGERDGDTRDLPQVAPGRGAAVAEVPAHLPFPADSRPAAGRGAWPATTTQATTTQVTTTQDTPAARPRPVRAEPGRRVPRGDERLREHRGPVLPGWVGVGVGALALTGCLAVLWRAGAVPAAFVAAFGATPRAYQGLQATHWPPLAFLGIVALLALGGLGRAKAGHAWVLTLFGRYRGTVRRTGLTWVSPLLLRRRVDVRLRHWRSEPMPAVDSGGLALRVVVQVVWQVKDTARATLAVEDHTEYLAEQVESAMARVLSQLPADAFHEDAPTLRDSEAVGDALTRMLATETEAVGIEVYSAQPTRIEYAPEVAEAMRRRRVAAIDAKHRDTVLTSVVDAVDDTVHRLTSRGLVELDDYERKALVKDLTVAFYTGRPE